MMNWRGPLETPAGLVQASVFTFTLLIAPRTQRVRHVGPIPHRNLICGTPCARIDAIQLKEHCFWLGTTFGKLLRYRSEFKSGFGVQIRDPKTAIQPRIPR